MKKEMASTSEVAKVLGVSPRTIQGAIKDGRLLSTGARGRFAKNIDLAEAQKVLGSRGNRATAPAHGRIEQNVLKAGGNPRAVLLAILQYAMLGEGADLDVIAAAFRCMGLGKTRGVDDKTHQLTGPPSRLQLCEFVAAIEGRSDPGGGFGHRLGMAIIDATGPASFNPGSIVGERYQSRVKRRRNRRRTIDDAEKIGAIIATVSASDLLAAVVAILSGNAPPHSKGAWTINFDYSSGRCKADLVRRPSWDSSAGRQWRPSYYAEPVENWSRNFSGMAPKVRTAIRRTTAFVGALAPTADKAHDGLAALNLLHLLGSAEDRKTSAACLEGFESLAPESTAEQLCKMATGLNAAYRALNPEIETVGEGFDDAMLLKTPVEAKRSHGGPLDVATISRVVGISRVSIYSRMPARGRGR